MRIEIPHNGTLLIVDLDGGDLDIRVAKEGEARKADRGNLLAWIDRDGTPHVLSEDRMKVIKGRLGK